jgi:tight adherence protein C
VALVKARRLVRLGCRWAQALQRCGDPRLATIGATLRHADAFGIPIADALERHAREAEDEAARAFEASLARAPVLMVVPLTVLVLPSFFLLGVAPFLRELARGW